ncbi:DUF4097 family beta strand repeat-containing protein [Anaerosporobacter sp.]|uniref:DUF4097 family beta strand repeat-containing protein n=1 Tax=Anaerosporobacter sp. TaxID=1872529 RepID=UPI00286F31BE|nr:DUF4097 family beta strand repeat-containing protein [Anaerosporobacter sp.]
MNREEYLLQIEKALQEANVDSEIISEIISDYEEHFRMGIKNNKTEEEICRELGSVEEIIAEIAGMEVSSQTESKAIKEVVEPKEAIEPKDLVESQEEIVEMVNSVETYEVESIVEEQETNYSDVPFTRVEIEGNCADVIITGGDEFKANYVNNGSAKDKLAYRFYYHQEGDTMYVGVKENFQKMLFRIFHSVDILLTIQIPAHVKEVEVKVASGDCKIADVELKNLSTCSASGDVKINQVTCAEASFHTSSGDIAIAHSKIECLGVSTSSGDIEITQTDAKFVESGSSSGDVEIEGGTIDKVEAGSTSGDIECSSLSQNYALNSVSGDISVRMKTDAEARYETISGDVDIRLENDSNGYVLNAATVSGDVNIRYEGMSQRDCKSGCYTYGNQGTNIHANTVSGDIDLKG